MLILLKGPASTRSARPATSARLRAPILRFLLVTIQHGLYRHRLLLDVPESGLGILKAGATDYHPGMTAVCPVAC
jgi:hypothetical protein